MPLPLFTIAIPVLHSSGAWIASTAASGYMAGTLSSSWIGAFVLGNSTLLSMSGLVSAAGIFGAGGGLAALSSSTALGIGSALSAVGLGGVANALGIAPAVTFLGVTPIGWTVALMSAIFAALGYYFTRKIMRRLNEEREKGGLEPITLLEIVKEVRLLEAQSMEAILDQLDNVSFSPTRNEVTINGQTFSIQRLKYVINKDGSEEIVFVTRTGQKTRVLLIKAAPDSDDLALA